MKGKRVKIEDIISLIKSKDGTFIKEELINKIRFITIQCNKDQHIWTTALSAIRGKNQWCWECYKRNKIKKVDYNKVIEALNNKNFKLLTPPPINFWSEIEIECQKHNWKWKTTYGHFERNNTNCRYCGHDAISFEDIQKVLVDKNVSFIKRLEASCPVRNILLKCNKHNHEWTTNARAIIECDRWCYYCALEARKTQFKVIQKAVEDRGGTLLTPNCTGSLTKIIVRCKNNHEWETYYDNINAGYWCPKCPYVKQTALFEIIQQLFPKYEVKYNYRGFKWLKSKKDHSKPMEIDIWVPKLKLAIEYDGEQHFKPIKFASSQTDSGIQLALKENKKRDALKSKLISAHPEKIKYFIRFTYKDNIDVESVKRKLIKNNIPVEE